MTRAQKGQKNAGFFLLLAILTAGIICFAGLNLRLLVSGDETRVAGIAAEMAVEGNYLIPKLNGENFLEYPPLCYWLIASSFKSFGICEPAAKLPSALAGFASVLLVFFWCIRNHYRPVTAFLASFILLTSSQFFDNIRHCTVDMLLSFWILFVWVAWTFSRKEDDFVSQSEPKSARILRLVWLGLAGLAMGGAVMTKGLIGFVLPLSAIGISQVVSDIQERKFRFSAYLRMAAVCLIAMIPVCCWLGSLYLEADYDAFYTVTYTNNIGRFSGSQGDHVEPFYYYLCKIPALFQPWQLLMLVSFFFFWKNRRSGIFQKIRFPLCCFLIPLLILCSAASKRVIYLLPLYAPCAVLTAYGISEVLYPRWKQYFVPAAVSFWNNRFWRRLLMLVALLCIAGAFTVAFLLVKHPSLYVLSGCSLVLFLFGTVWKGLNRKERVMDVFCSFAFLILVVDGTFFLNRDRQDHIEKMFVNVSELELMGLKPVHVYHSERTKGASFFYLHHRLESYYLPENVDLDCFTPETGIVWIIRRRLNNAPSNWIAYGDSHWLVFPVKQDESIEPDDLTTEIFTNQN